MADVDTLLDNELNNDASGNKITLTINEPNRAMTHDGSVLLGVEQDYKAERIYFKAPKTIFMDKDIDLSSDNVKVFINFQNGNKETYIYQCTDKAVSADGFLTFSWLLTEKVTEVSGAVKFIVCIKNMVTDESGVETLQNEWHSTPYEGTVLAGINVGDKTPEIISDPLTLAYALTVKVDEAYLIVKNFEASVVTLQNTINAKADQSAVEELNSKIDAKADKTSVEALGETVNSKADQTVVDALGETVNSKADKTTVDALSETVESKANQSDLDDLNTAVTTKASQTAVDALGERVTDLENSEGSAIDLDEINSKIDAKADKNHASTTTTYGVASATQYGHIKLGTNTVQSVAANEPSSNTGRTYPVQKDSSGKAVVNVPWTSGSGGGASQSELDALSETVAKKADQSDLEALSATVNNKADKSAVDAIQNKLNEGCESIGDDAFLISQSPGVSTCEPMWVPAEEAADILKSYMFDNVANFATSRWESGEKTIGSTRSKYRCFIAEVESTTGSMKAQIIIPNYAGTAKHEFSMYNPTDNAYENHWIQYVYTTGKMTKDDGIHVTAIWGI